MSAPSLIFRVIAYQNDKLEEQTFDSLQSALELCEPYQNGWIDISGDLDVAIHASVLNDLKIHRLAQQDLCNPDQRAKVEQYPDNLFVVCRAAEAVSDEEHTIEPYFLFLTDRTLVTIQHTEHDCFDKLRDRVRAGDAKIRQKSIDYLLYMILDSVVQSYFPVVEKVGDQLEEIEDAIVDSPNRSSMASLHFRKRQLLQLRRSIWPHRELLISLARDDYREIRDETQPYFRDSYDHVVQIIDLVETSRELCSDLVDLYMSSQSQKMNEVMKVLTIISTIFIPLSFVAGVYGMNFNTSASPFNMPELNWYYGYPIAIGIMAAIALGLIVMFWRYGWLTDGNSKP